MDMYMCMYMYIYKYMYMYIFMYTRAEAPLKVAEKGGEGGEARGGGGKGGGSRTILLRDCRAAASRRSVPLRRESPMPLSLMMCSASDKFPWA